ncbi:px domain-containing protein [Colletotrichum truncatum]|uniref:Px domain-containing protein n=1 Tax=Colletotrichum truncatum TaxID=5467 RepID=A0ACC3Z4G2_COLTU
MGFPRTPRGGRRGLMYKSPSSSKSSNWRSPGRYGNTSPPDSSQKKRLDGLYLEGNWYCNCEPRLQAKHFQVKKKGPNTGRYFYTCDARKCNFFLWDEDAKNRASDSTLTLPPMPEDGALVEAMPATAIETFTPGSRAATRPLNSAAVAPASLPTPALSTPRQKSMGDYLTRHTEETPSRAGKRKRVLFEFSDDEQDDYGLENLSSDEERQMNDAMERSAKKLRSTAPATPSVRRETDEFTTMPGTVTRTLFPDSRYRREDNLPARADTSSVPFSTVSSPSTMTVRPSLSPPPTSQVKEEEQQLDPTDEVLSLLRGQRLDEATMRNVKDVLRRFAMKAKGAARGRESVRAALKVKDERIAELQDRVTSLENRNRVQREEISEFKAGIMDLYSKY